MVGKPEVAYRTFAGGVMAECSICINTGMRHTRDLTDEQWKTLDPLIPKPMKREDGRGRPWESRRSVLNGVLWVLRTGAPWADPPEGFGAMVVEVLLTQTRYSPLCGSRPGFNIDCFLGHCR